MCVRVHARGRVCVCARAPPAHPLRALQFHLEAEPRSASSLSLTHYFSVSFPLSLFPPSAAPCCPAAAHVGSVGVSLCSTTDISCHFSLWVGHAGVKEVAFFSSSFPLVSLSSLLCGLKRTKCRPERHYRPLTSATRRT